MRRIVREFNLCPQLCFMQHDDQECEGIREGYCHGACKKEEPSSEYNLRVQQAIKSLQSQPSFAIMEKGLNGDDKSCVLVWEGKFYGMGYIPADMQITRPDELKELVTPYRENSFIRNLVNGYAARFPSKIIRIKGNN